MQSAQSSSADLPPGASTQDVPLDQDALDALAFAERGYPDGEIFYSEDAPRLTPEQLGEFRPASFRILNLR
jgi:hypothetical protein